MMTMDNERRGRDEWKGKIEGVGEKKEEGSWVR